MYRADNKDVKHFMLTCPGYAHKQWLLIKHTTKKKKALILKLLLNNPDMTIHIANYIEVT